MAKAAAATMARAGAKKRASMIRSFGCCILILPRPTPQVNPGACASVHSPPCVRARVPGLTCTLPHGRMGDVPPIGVCHDSSPRLSPRLSPRPLVPVRVLPLGAPCPPWALRPCTACRRVPVLGWVVVPALPLWPGCGARGRPVVVVWPGRVVACGGGDPSLLSPSRPCVAPGVKRRVCASTQIALCVCAQMSGLTRIALVWYTWV